MSTIKTKIERHVEREKVKERLVKFLQVPSFRTPLMEKEPMVLNFIREVVFEELKDIDLKSLVIDKTGNLIAKIGSRKNGRTLLYVAYAMTGEPGTMKDPFSAKVVEGNTLGLEGEFVWGRGANEQKGSLAAMITAFEAVGKLGVEPPGELILVVSTGGEFGTHEGLRQVIEGDGVRADQAVVAGESDKIQIGNKGRLKITITVKGHATQSRNPWKGVDAIQGMFAVYDCIRSLIPNPSTISHPFLGKATLIPMSLESFPKEASTLQSECILTLDRRLLPGESPETALTQISDLVKGLEPYKVSVQPGPYLLPSEVSPDATIVKDLVAAIKTMGGVVPDLEYSHAAYDAGYLNQYGIETIRYGAGNHYFPADFGHSDKDVVSVDETVDVAKVLIALALRTEL